MYSLSLSPDEVARDILDVATAACSGDLRHCETKEYAWEHPNELVATISATQEMTSLGWRSLGDVLGPVPVLKKRRTARLLAAPDGRALGKIHVALVDDPLFIGRTKTVVACELLTAFADGSTLATIPGGKTIPQLLTGDRTSLPLSTSFPELVAAHEARVSRHGGDVVTVTSLDAAIALLDRVIASEQERRRRSDKRAALSASCAAAARRGPSARAPSGRRASRAPTAPSRPRASARDPRRRGRTATRGAASAASGAAAHTQAIGAHGPSCHRRERLRHRRHRHQARSHALALRRPSGGDWRMREWACVMVVAALACAASPRASADPRWWQSDLRVTSTPGASVTPHANSPQIGFGGPGRAPVFITWAESEVPGGNSDIWLAVTFDDGCTFCPPTRLTDTPQDETNPRVAAVSVDDSTWSIAVIFERPASGEVVIARDSFRLGYLGPADALCDRVASLGPGIIASAQYVTLGGGGAVASQPDIAAIGHRNFQHFHATWTESSPLGLVIRHGRDLTGRGLGWRADPPRSVAAAGPLEPWVGSPRIAADLSTDPDPLSGIATLNRSGVSIAFVRTRSVGPATETEIMGLRSVDSGTTFSPSGERADLPAEPISDVLDADDGSGVRIALDAGGRELLTSDTTWVTGGWSTGRGAAPPSLGCDRRHVASPASPVPDWLAPGDLDLGVASIPADGAPSVAVLHRLVSSAWTAWQDGRFGAGEIVVRAGMLDAAASSPLDLSALPFPPVRAGDPSSSLDVLLTSCIVDDAAIASCLPARAAGEAGSVSLTADRANVFAVWSDTRDGNAEIYFKRTDTFFVAPALRPILVAGCDPDGTAHVDVTFALEPSCPVPFGRERVLRYLIHWRSDPAGGYDSVLAPLVVPHAGEPGPLVTRRISGLAPDTAWLVVVVPEDEARNIFPADFDPSRAPATTPVTEAEIVTPSCVAAGPCLWRANVTLLSPHVPPRPAVYLVPPTPDDIHLQGPSLACPFVSGDLEPDVSALDNGVPLSLYQVSLTVSTLRLAKSARTIRFTF